MEEARRGIDHIKYDHKCKSPPHAMSLSPLTSSDEGVKVGWPYLAYIQDYLHNRSIHRRFGPLTQRVLLYQEVQLSRMEAELLELDIQDERTDSNLLRGLSPAQTHDHGSGDHVQNRKDALLEAIMPRLDSYREYRFGSTKLAFITLTRLCP